jgi:hypothetical protein
MARGWEVYGSLSPSNSFDLVTYKNGAYLSVNVKEASLEDYEDDVFVSVDVIGGALSASQQDKPGGE